MSKYYEVIAIVHGTDNVREVLFGSFDRSDCVYELEAERSYWRAEGYHSIGIKSRLTSETPDPEVYA